VFFFSPCFPCPILPNGRFGLSDLEFFAGLPCFYDKLDYDGVETLDSALPSFSFGAGVVRYGIAGNEGLGLFALTALDFLEKMTGELREVVDAWLDKYHFYRPHEALNFLTPAEFSATLGLSIPRAPPYGAVS
jgi:hypothetical protein